MRQSRDMGRKLLGELEGGEDLGIGTTKDVFHSRGTRPRYRDRLKMKQRGYAMKGAATLSILEEMVSGPEAVLVASESISETISSSVQRKFSGHTLERVRGGIEEREGLFKF